jgi:riboflavin transporter FmnP
MDDQVTVVSVVRRVALTTAMAGLANVLALLSVPIPISPFQTQLHLIQLPVILAELLAGRLVS